MYISFMIFLRVICKVLPSSILDSFWVPVAVTFVPFLIGVTSFLRAPSFVLFLYTNLFLNKINSTH